MKLPFVELEMIFECVKNIAYSGWQHCSKDSWENGGFQLVEKGDLGHEGENDRHQISTERPSCRVMIKGYFSWSQKLVLCTLFSFFHRLMDSFDILHLISFFSKPISALHCKQQLCTKSVWPKELRA